MVATTHPFALRAQGRLQAGDVSGNSIEGFDRNDRNKKGLKTIIEHRELRIIYMIYR